jgi:hypothetical protein
MFVEEGDSSKNKSMEWFWKEGKQIMKEEMFERRGWKCVCFHNLNKQSTYVF